MKIDINKLAKDVFAANKAKGFHEKGQSNEVLLMLIVTELSEAVEADRKSRLADIATYNANIDTDDILESDRDVYFIESFERFIKDTVEDELADTAIRLLDLAGLNKVNIRLNDTRIEDFTSCLSEETLPEMIFHVCREAVRCPANSIAELEEVIPRTLEGVIAICEHLKIALWQHVELKMQFNETRPNKHGKKY
jgi:hypothetical protein